MELSTSAAVPQIARPANPRMIQAASTSEVVIALAAIAAVALLLATGFMMGRMQQRRKARSRIRARQLKKRIDSREIQKQRRNLRLVNPKRR
jgi:uncharacterized protein HemX